MNLLNKYLIARAFIGLDGPAFFLIVMCIASYFCIALYGWIVWFLLFIVGGALLLYVFIRISANYIAKNMTEDEKISFRRNHLGHD